MWVTWAGSGRGTEKGAPVWLRKISWDGAEPGQCSWQAKDTPWCATEGEFVDTPFLSGRLGTTTSFGEDVLYDAEGIGLVSRVAVRPDVTTVLVRQVKDPRAECARQGYRVVEIRQEWTGHPRLTALALREE